MKVKTAELTGHALDRMVMIALGYTYQKGMPEDTWAAQEVCKKGWWRGFGGGSWTCLTCLGDDHPSTDWAHGGPIIEQKKIKVAPNLNGTWLGHKRHTTSHPLVAHPVLAGWTNKHGPTPLIAAMRCLVAGELGDEVDIPEELL